MAIRITVIAWIISCCWLPGATGQSQTVLAVDEHSTTVWPSDLLEYCIAPTDGPCPADGWKPMKRDVLALGVVDGDAVLTGQLHNASDIPRSFRLELANPSLDQVSIEVHIAGDTTFHYLYGDRWDFGRRAVRHRNFVVPVELQPFGTAGLTIRVSRQKEAVFVPIRITSEAEFLRFYGKDYLLLGGLFGTYSIYIIFVIGLFLLARSRLFVYYALLDLCLLAYVVFDTGYGFQFLWPAWPFIQDLIIPIAAYAYLACIIMFSREFFSTAIKYPGLDRFFRVYLVFALVVFGVLQALVLTSLLSLDVSIAITAGLFLIFGIVVTALGGITYFQAGRREGFWFLFLFTMHLVMFAFVPLQKGYLGAHIVHPDGWLFNHLPVFTSTPHYIFVIMTAEMVIVSAIIAFRFQDVLDEYNISRWRMERINRQSIQAFIEGQEKERESLAGRLDREVGQGLRSISENLHALQERYPASSSLEGTLTQLEDVEEDLGHIASDFVTDWNSVRTDKLILKALEQLRLAMPELELIVLMDKEVAAFPADELIKLNLYRILQETCNNVLKHAKCETVTADIKLIRGDLKISIADDGVGFDASQDTVRKGIGLRNIETRTRAMHGEFRIASEPGVGTTVELTIPYKNPDVS